MDSDTEALVLGLMLGIIWPAVLMGYVILWTAHRTIGRVELTPEENQAVIARLERETCQHPDHVIRPYLEEL